MAIIRVNKTKNYTVMSNVHLKEKEMSLKAKGLLSVMLSVSDEWNFSIAGLSAICKENETAIKSALNELKQFGYLVVTKKCPSETKSGRIEYDYDVYEQPLIKQETENQGVENQGVEILQVEKQGQLNNNNKDTKKLNTKKLNTKKKIYGAFENVALSDEEFEKIQVEGFNELIDELSEYKESTGKKYKSDYATILAWARRKNLKKGSENKKDQHSQLDSIARWVMEEDRRENNYGK